MKEGSAEIERLRDGWTLTHVCGGVARTLIWSGIVARCPKCRWTADLAPLHPNVNRRETDD